MKLPFKKKWLGLIAVIGIIAVPLVVKSKSGGDGKPVDIAIAAQQEIKPTILASGSLTYRTEVDLRSEVTARVQEILVAEGDDVKAGQLLLRLDPESYRNAIEREEAGLRQSSLSIEQQRTALELRRIQFERTRKLFEARMVDHSKFDQDKNQLQLAEVELKSSKEALRRADAVLKEAREQLGKTEIRAPMAGRVVNLPIKVGETAIPSISSQAGAQLLTIADTSAIQAEIKVDEGDIAKVNVGQAVDIYPAAYPETALKGLVEKVALASTTEGQSRAYKVTVSLKPDTSLKLRSGMSARAEIFLSDGSKRLAVPVEAVITEEKENAKTTQRFLVLAQDGKAKRVEIELGTSDDRWQEITKGLKVGDSVVTGPGKTLNELKNGDPLKANEKKADKKSKNKDEAE
ncbi:efflux RND transporter periplasmic adaptor subunit [Chitinimonas viridis]|uniref:Efflux RND transporter periplasmic adaptor subunit n=1 Tax=Chitinimonas viridis TaxID=664880 RepID=A0ABT8B5J1_9NEIS|nr:efflux RND transporter periplasmic adaptor subunit [Chitinimonas viridis]MDN3577523.1 efflux RND transporter periplasmic adaptor subunit [Chitinimonas viridis]